MTSLFQVLAHDEQEQARLTRRAAAAFSAQTEAQFGVFLRSAASDADYDARVTYAADQIARLAHAAVDEYGAGDPDVLVNSVVALYRPAQPDTTIGRTASFSKEAKPKMCPFHKDVVDISLSAGDPAAGFSALQSQWGGARHCEGEGYKGEKCKFKPQMTTQSFWDDRKDKAAEKRRLREEQQAELDTTQEVEQIDIDDALDSAPDDAPVGNESPEAEGAEIIPFPTRDNAEGGAEAADVPMSMAARAASFQALATPTTGLGGPEPKIDKRKWTPQTVREVHPDDPNGRWPTVRKDVVAPIQDRDSDELREIGEKGALERQDVAKDTAIGVQNGPSSWTGNEGQANPVTSRQAADSITPRCPKCNSATTGMLDEANARCHACGNVWEPEDIVPEKLSRSADVQRNPIIDLMNGEDSSFPAEATIQRAILAHKRH